MPGALSFLAGVLLALGAARLPSVGWLAATALTLPCCALAGLWRHAWPRRLALLALGLFLTNCAIARWHSLLVPTDSPDRRLLLEGNVVTVPARFGAEVRFDAEVILVEGADQRDAQLRRVRLTWRDAPVVPRVGERWRWLVRQQPYADSRNFAGPQPERGAFRDGVHLRARVLVSALNERQRMARSSIDGIRARIADRIAQTVGDPDAAALIAALAVGFTDRMSLDQWRVFNATGTTHLVAISGLHVTLFAMFAFVVARSCWRWLPGARRFEREPFAWLLGIVSAGAYALLAGWSVPTQRTLLMLCAFGCARVMARHVGAARTWSLALIAVLVLDPMAPLAAGFWLSFVAVGVILLCTATRIDHHEGTIAARLGTALRLQLSIMLALAPLTFALLDNVSLAGVWGNLAAIPLVSFVLVPLVLMGAVAALLLPAAGALFFGLAEQVYRLCWPGLVWAADTPLATWRAVPEAWWIALAAPAALILMCRWPWRLRLTGIAAALPLIFGHSRMPEHGGARIAVFDAGRGSMVLIATHSRVALFDTGDSWNTRGARLRQLALPALDALAVREIDLLVLPRLDADRAQGAALLAFERKVHRIRVGGGWPGTRLGARACKSERFRWDGVAFELSAAGPERRACMLRVSVGEHSLRFGGKWIEGSARLALATGGQAGSRSRKFELERRRASGVRAYDTRHDGAIEIALGTQGIVVTSVARVSRHPFAWRRFPDAP